MKKSLVNYLFCWILLVALFNILGFFTPPVIAGYDKYTGKFWVGYIFITVCFLGNLIFSYFSLNENNREKRILNVPLTIVSYIELIILVVVGALCMITPYIPVWLGVVICATILVFSVIVLISIKCVGENTSNANVNLNNKTESFREMVDMARIICDLTNDENKVAASKVFDAIRYSDSISTPETYEIDERIKSLLASLRECLNIDNNEAFNEEAEKVVHLVEERKVICMSAKRKVK